MMRYRIKLVLILLVFVVVLLSSSYIATRTVIRDAVIEDAYHELDRGGKLFSQLMATRAQQLTQSVNVLTDDFGFKQAVASRDSATIRSALINHAARMNADLAFVIDQQGTLTASSGELSVERYQLFSELKTASSGGKTRYAPLIIDGALYQVVFSPVNAPLQIGTAGIGFEVDQALSEHLKKLTDLDVSFLLQDNARVEYLSGTLEPQARLKLHQLPALKLDAKHSVWQDDKVLHNRVLIAQQPQTIVAVLQVPLARALKPFAVLDTQLLSLALVFSIVAGFIALLLARNVTEPIKRLAIVASNMAQGKYDSVITVQSGKDEFAELARAFISMQRAIAERERKIVFQSGHDRLTGLANRSQVFPLLQKIIHRAEQDACVALVVVVDIYKFTQINDILGAKTGDQVLQELSARLRLFAGADGYALRLGSDEFLMLISEPTVEEGIKKVWQLRDSSSHPLHINSTDIRAELNVGYSVYPTDGKRSELLLRRANLALNHARQGYQGVSSYHSGWDEDHLRRLQLLSDFKPALERGEIKLHYQPKITPTASCPVAGEALIRWQHPQLGFVNPEEFINVIESAGQISRLTRWVIEQVITLLAELQLKHQNLIISINLSALDLLESDLCDYIATLLQKHSVDSRCLCFEITESAIMREAEKSLSSLNALHKLGVLLSIDDYGTGYSSLSQLKKLPVDELKIDKSFILDLDHNLDDRQIVKSTIELSHSLGLVVTAEGVETAASRDWLLANGCDTLQGYYYSKALPSDGFDAWCTQFLAQCSGAST